MTEQGEYGWQWENNNLNLYSYQEERRWCGFISVRIKTQKFMWTQCNDMGIESPDILREIADKMDALNSVARKGQPDA